MAKQGDGLFLLEVLIDKIIFLKTPCFPDRDFNTCVNVQCPAVEPIEICDSDPGCAAKGNSQFIKFFNRGKSCLFSLKESDISSAMSRFPINVTIYKSLPCGCLPTKIIMGECTIDMTKEFVEARNKFLENPSTVSYQALKDSFHILGPDGQETGEVVMFLRISCFGKLIVTQFQGTSAPNVTSAAGGSTTIVDRSCDPKKDFQSPQDPCACGGTRGRSGKAMGQYSGTLTSTEVCPPGQDPYNSMPCEDPEDPCYCSGGRRPEKQQIACRNTDQYCLHTPQGYLLHTLYDQESDYHNNELKLSTFSHKTSGCSPKLTTNDLSVCVSQTENNYIKNQSSLQTRNSARATIKDEQLTNKDLKLHVFGRVTTVYVALIPIYKNHHTSGTQATASLNKCLQVYPNSKPFVNYSENYSTSTMSTTLYNDSARHIPKNHRYSDVYFFGRKKDIQKNKGMGQNVSKTSLSKSNRRAATATRSENVKSGPSATQLNKSSVNKSPVDKSIGKYTDEGVGTCTSKSVSIREDKPLKPCPSLTTTKGEMMATISHIRIGPKETCPVHGNQPCQGPRCIIASSGEEQGQVKVTTMTNPRRGVFELVIRKLTGAPLARNDLMLEWTPPPSQPAPCTTVCPVTTCLNSNFSCSKKRKTCKIKVCPPPPCKIKRCKKPPCYIPCYPMPCKKVCCIKPSRTTIVYALPRSRSPSPCKVPCSPITCYPSRIFGCCSSPCLKPCRVGRRKPRKIKSQPKIKSHITRASPCLNRSKACPVVQCRSLPGPCIGCCGFPPLLPRKCYLPPCKPLRCYKSACMLCCS